MERKIMIAAVAGMVTSGVIEAINMTWHVSLLDALLIAVVVGVATGLAAAAVIPRD